MKRAFDRTAEAMRRSEDSLCDKPNHSFTPHSRHSQPYNYQYHREPLGRRESDEVSEDSSGAFITPFTILLEMIEGKRPLDCYSTSRCSSSFASPAATTAAALYYRNAPPWSTAPFFKLYARYLSEFSGAMQMLTKMRTGPSTLRKNLKQLQSHPACEFNDITTYLLAPVQRLPRYLLLVRKMIQYTEKIEKLVQSGKRLRARVGIRRSGTPARGCLPTTPGFPKLETLKQAEEALHCMLLELDEMIGGDVADLKVEGRDANSAGGEDEFATGGGGCSGGGGGGGTGGHIKANSVYSNNCSDSVDANSTSNTVDGIPTAEAGDGRSR